MAGAKTALLIEERMKAVRVQVDQAFNSVESEVARLREQLEDALRRIETIEQKSLSD